MNRNGVIHIGTQGERLNTSPCRLFIFACGFETRSLHLWRKLQFPNESKYLAFAYSGGPAGNDASKNAVIESARAGDTSWITIPSVPDSTVVFDSSVRQALNGYDVGIGREVFFDISGFQNWAICIILAALLERVPVQSIQLLYTAAAEYYPTKKEYERLIVGSRSMNDIEPPRSLTYDVRNNLIPERFSGNSIDIGQTCLILFAGYERHRSQAAIDDINPAKIVLAYGVPPAQQMRWRCDLSRYLHTSLAMPYVRAEREVGTDDVCGAVSLIGEFYANLYEDHLIRVAPMNSKLHGIAAVCAWRRFPDIQLCFPQPVSFLPERFSGGTSDCFRVDLNEVWTKLQTANFD